MIAPSEYGIHSLAMLLLAHSLGIQNQSHQLYSLLMAITLLLAQLIKPFEYGSYLLLNLLLHIIISL